MFHNTLKYEMNGHNGTTAPHPLPHIQSLPRGISLLIHMTAVVCIMTAGSKEMRETYLLKNGFQVQSEQTNALILYLMTGTMNNGGTKVLYKGSKVILDGRLVESEGGAVNQQLDETTF
jgi:hypothetical protein